MPATTDKQAHTGQMAMALKHGHLKLSDIPKGARKAVQSMAKMSEDQLKDFMHTKKKPKTLVE